MTHLVIGLAKLLLGELERTRGEWGDGGREVTSCQYAAS